MGCGKFDTTRKGNHSSLLTPTVVVGRSLLPSESALKVIHPLRKTPTSTDFPHNVSTLRDSHKRSITTNTKLTTGFSTSHRWSANVNPKFPKGWLKERFFVFKQNSTADRLRGCQLSSPVSVINIWWSAAMLITSTVEICIQQLGRAEEMVWLPYDASLSAAAETLMGFLKRVIVSPAVYPRFLKFLHVDIQSTGRTLSRPWSRARQPNDVMPEIECAQLHSELLRRRHSTRQSHGLLALAKHLYLCVYSKCCLGFCIVTWSQFAFS